jgi:lipopolysaccharide export system protein LptC
MKAATAAVQILGGLLASCLLSACKPGSSSRAPQEVADHLDAPYDYYINGMRTHRFSTDGIASELTATRLLHYPSDDHAELENPVLHWSQRDRPPWTLTADTGNVHHAGDAEEITLTGNVKANTTHPQSGPLQVETTTLDVLPAGKSAKTAAAVEIITASSHLWGTGMQLNLSDSTIDLLKNVRGTYAP